MKKTTLMAFLLALLAPMMSAWAYDTYYAKLTVGVASSSTGRGTVYAAKSDTATTGSADATGDSGSTKITLYAFAKPNYGYKLKGWATDAAGNSIVANSNKSPFPVQVDASNNTSSSSPKTEKRYAVFETNTDSYTLTLNKPDGLASYTVTAPNGFTGNLSQGGSETVYKGDQYSFKYTLSSDEYDFINWTVNGEQKTSNPVSVSISGNTTVVLTLKKKVTYTATCQGSVGGTYKANGTTVSGSDYEVSNFGSVTVSLSNPVPKAGYAFYGWYKLYSNGVKEYLSYYTSVSTGEMKENIVIGAEFREVQDCTVKFIAPAEGKITYAISGGNSGEVDDADKSETVPAGADVTLTATSDYANRRAKWYTKDDSGEKVYFSIDSNLTRKFTSSVVVGVDFIPVNEKIANAIEAAQSSSSHEAILAADAEIVLGTSIEIPSDIKIDLDGHTLYVDGTLTVNGTLVNGTVSKCLKVVKQTGADGMVPINPYGNVKYWKTDKAVASTASVTGWSGTLGTHLTVMRGDGVAVRGAITSSTQLVKCTFDGSIAVNHVTAIGAASDTADISENLSYILLANVTINGPVVLESSKYNRIRNSATIDCAGWACTMGNKQISSSNSSKILNAPTFTYNSEYWQNGAATFYNCPSISIKPVKGTPPFYLYDSGSSQLTFTQNSSGTAKCLFYSGKFDTDLSGNGPSWINSDSKIYGGGFKVKPNKKWIETAKQSTHTFTQHSDGYWYLDVNQDRNVASISGTKYLTIDEALAYLKDNSAATIMLLKNVQLTEPYTLEAGKSLVIELNGCHIDAPNGFIKNYGSLSIRDNDNSLAVCGVTSDNGSNIIENYENGTVDICYGLYNGNFAVNGGTFTTHHGKFIGSVANNGGTLNLKGGVFSSDVSSLMNEGYHAFAYDGWYYVGRFPKPEDDSSSIASFARVLTAMPAAHKTLYLAKKTYSLGSCSDLDEWKQVAELKAAYALYDDEFYFDILAGFDRDIAANTVQATIDTKLGPRSDYFPAMSAGVLERIFSPRITQTPISYTRFIYDNGEGNYDTMEAGISDVNNANAGTACVLAMDLWKFHDKTKTTKDSYLTILALPYVFGAGNNVAMIRPTTGTTTFKSTLQGAIDAVKNNGGGTVRLANNCNEIPNFDTAGTYIVDSMGFEHGFSDAEGGYTVAEGLSVTTEIVDSSVATLNIDGKAVLPDAVAIKYVVVAGSAATAVDAPTAVSGLVYDGTVKTGVAAGTGYTLSGNTATAAGSYTATATLEEGYVWSDDSSEAKEISWSIGKASLTATAENKSVIRGATVQYAIAYSGFVNGEDASALTAAPTVSCDYVPSDFSATATSYTISLSGGSAANYEFALVSGTLTVTPSEASIGQGGDATYVTSISEVVSAAEAGTAVSVTLVTSEPVTVDGMSAGKTLTVTPADGVEANVTVTPADGAFIVESAVEGGTKYESKKITVEMKEPVSAVAVTKVDNGTESEVTDTAEINAAVTQLMGNHDVPRTDNTDKLDVLDKITVTPTKIVLAEDGSTVRSATFDVTPKFNAGQSLAEGQKLKFRLPVDSEATQLSSVVYHNGAQFGVYSVTTKNNEKYIEIESDAFSPYGYELLDGETANPVAAIGTTGYATLPDAIAAAEAAYETAGSYPTITVLDATAELDAAADWKLSNDKATLVRKAYVAQVGTTKYENLMEAINVAYNGGTVELLADVTVDHWHQNIWTLAEGSAEYPDGRLREPTAGPSGLTINGNGHSLTINGIDSGSNGNHIFAGSRNLTVSNITINAASGVNGIGLKSGTISDVTFNVAGSNPAIYTSGSAGCEEGEHIEIRNCTFNTSASDSYGIYSCDPENGVDSGTIISGNTFNTRRSVVLRNDMQFLNNVVNGAKGVTVAGGSTAVVCGNYFADTTTSRSINVYPSNATIANNVILGPIELENETYAVAPDLSNNYWGGDAPANLPEGVVVNSYYTTYTGYASPAQDGSLFALSDQVVYVAQVGETPYATLAEALANAANGDTVTMLDNVTLTEPLNVTLGDKAVTLDLGGKTLAGRTNLKSGSLTIKNGTVAGGSAQALNVYGSADSAAQNYSVLTIASDVNVTADVYGVCMFGATAGSNGYGAVVNIAGTVTTTGDGKNGAVFVSGNLGKNVSGDAHNVINVTGKITSATDAAIAMNGLATVNVSDGAEVTGNTAIAVKRGVLNVTGGTIRATGEKNYDAAAYANGTEMTGAAISVSDTYSQYGAMAVNVSGGTVKSDNADALFKKDGDYKADATIAVSAGSFSSAVAEEFCAAGYIPTAKDPGTGMYTVKHGEYVAQIVREGAVVAKYETFDAALTDALSGDTVQLLADVTGVTTTYNIDKAVTIDGQGQYKIVAGENTTPRGIFESWGGGRSMFALKSSTANVTFKDLTIDGGEGHYYTYFVHVKSGTATFTDVELLRGGEADASGKAGVGYGAAILADGGNVVVSGSFYADTHGEALEEGETGDRTAGIFPFTAILYQGGGIHFDDGTTADIGQDLLLVGMQGALDLSDESAKAQVQDMLDAMNVPTGYVPYTLKVADNATTSFTGASPRGWNDIIDYGKGIMDVSSSLGIQMDKTTTPVEVGLVADTVLPDEFTYEDANFTINGNGNALSGTIVYTDGAGTMENVAMGTEQAPLVLDMTGLGEGKSINLGSGVVADNVTIKVTEEQAASMGQTIITWNTEGETAEEAATFETINVAVVDSEGAPVTDPATGEAKVASVMWDAELGIGYIGPCEARLTGPTHDKPIYTSLKHAIELAEQTGDTVTLLMDIANVSGTYEIDKSITLDGTGYKVTAAPVTTHRDVVNAWAGSTAMFKLKTGDITFRNITLDGDATHAYTYLVSADNSTCSLTTENITLLHGGEITGDANGAALQDGAGYGAAIHLNNGASLTVKDGFYADTHGAPAEAGQTIAKAAGVFPFTGILPEGGSSVLFDLTEDTDANPTVEIGEDLLLVGMVGVIPHDEVQGILDYMKVPSRFIPYTLTLSDGSAYAFTGASPRTWNDIIDYGKDIMDVSTAIGYQGLDKKETPVEVGLLTDTVLPDTFTYQDANFSVNGNGNALSGTIVFTDDAEGGMLRNIKLGTEGKPLVLDLTQTTNAVDLGAAVTISDITVKMTEDQARLGKVVFDWDPESVTGDDVPNHGTVEVTVVDDQGGATGDTKSLVWDEEYGIAYIGPVEVRLSGPGKEPSYMDLTNAFDIAAGGDTITLFSSGVSLGEPVYLPAGTLLFATNKYELALGENAAVVFTNATTVFRCEMDLLSVLKLEGDVASGYILRTAVDNTTNVYTVVQRGEYHVVGTTEDGDVGTAVIKVADSWVEEHVGANVKTANQVETFLNSTNSVTNMREWEMYVLNQATPFRVTAVGKADNAVSTTLVAPASSETTGFTVAYSLDETLADGSVKTPGTRQPSRDFAVPVASVTTHAFYRVRAHLTSGESTLVVDSANTIGVLKATASTAQTIVAVPWAAFGGGDIAVADLLRTDGLSADDELFVYNPSTQNFRAWTLGSGKTWEPTTVIAAGTNATPGDDASSVTVACGSGVLLKRGSVSAPLCFVGEVASGGKSALSAAATSGKDGGQSWNLVASPSVEALDIANFPAPSSGGWDRIIVLTSGAPLNLTYKNGNWGYNKVEVKNGMAVPTRVTEGVSIPAGVGFWYLNSGAAREIEW